MSMSNQEIRDILQSMENRRAVETTGGSGIDRVVGGNFGLSQKMAINPKLLKRNHYLGYGALSGGTKVGELKDMDLKDILKYGKDASKHMTKENAKRMVKLGKEIVGSGFWGDFKHGFDSVIKPVASIAKPLMPLAGPYGVAGAVGLSALGYGKSTGGVKKKSTSGAKSLGEKYAKEIMKAEGLQGSGFWGDFKHGFDSVIKPVASIAKPLMPLAGPYGVAGAVGLSALGYGKSTGGAKKKRNLSEKQIQRNKLVKEIMKGEGMTLPQASKYIKQHNLI